MIQFQRTTIPKDNVGPTLRTQLFLLEDEKSKSSNDEIFTGSVFVETQTRTLSFLENKMNMNSKQQERFQSQTQCTEVTGGRSETE
mmetsp:Transcript_4750/g.11665  ORF Transcript_4750/g.11665 Transcript_4750/m.11665 type:complete len:86 (-) Transcript_4750:13-270(-)